jgi:hypothetical protein
MSESEIGKFTSRDLKELQHSITTTAQVAETHFGLGARVAFAEVLSEADMGMLLIGLMGTGKTRTLEAIQELTQREYLGADYKTLYSLADFDKGKGKILKMSSAEEKFVG